MKWCQINDTSGMKLVEGIITSTMLRLALFSGGDPSHLDITEGVDKEDHANVAMDKGGLQLVPYSPTLAMQCSTTSVTKKHARINRHPHMCVCIIIYVYIYIYI